MQYKVTWAENKSPDWKKVSIEGLDGVNHVDVSVNRTDRKGRVFPNFDGIMPGATVDGNVWAADSGKKTLFAPDAPRTGGGGGARSSNNAAITKNMDTKHQHVQEAQQNKGKGIMISAAFRDATLIVLELAKQEGGWDFDSIQAKHKQVRDWYIGQWKTKEQEEDVPF